MHAAQASAALSGAEPACVHRLQDSARRLWRRAVEVCKPPTKAAFVGSTAMQVLLAWARLELQDGNLRVVRPVLPCVVLCWPASVRFGQVK